jgi:hypothetical protein
MNRGVSHACLRCTNEYLSAHQLMHLPLGKSPQSLCALCFSVSDKTSLWVSMGSELQVRVHHNLPYILSLRLENQSNVGAG